MDQGTNFLTNQFSNRHEKRDQQNNRKMDKGCEQAFSIKDYRDMKKYSMPLRLDEILFLLDQKDTLRHSVNVQIGRISLSGNLASSIKIVHGHLF